VTPPAKSGFRPIKAGHKRRMNLRKVISKRLRHTGDGVDVQGDVDAVIAANVGERGGSTSASTKQTVRSRRTASARPRDDRREDG
jgi:hypothetical protein